MRTLYVILDAVHRTPLTNICYSLCPYALLNETCRTLSEIEKETNERYSEKMMFETQPIYYTHKNKQYGRA